MIRKVFIFYFFIFFGASLVYADSFPRFTKTDDNNRETRIEYAKRFKARVVKIRNSIPSPSPKEQEWIEDELEKCRATQNLGILENLEDKIVFHFHRAIIFLSNLQWYLTCIEFSDSAKEEMAIWNRIAIRLLESEGPSWESVYKLYKEGYIKPKLITHFREELVDRETLYTNNGRIPATQIMRHIIQPYLAGDQ